MSTKIYEPEFKKKIVQLRLEEGRTLQSLTDEYGVVKSTINAWCKQYSKECQEKAQKDPNYTNEAEMMKENLRLKRELEEARKEISFLKKAAAFFAKEID